MQFDTEFGTQGPWDGGAGIAKLEEVPSGRPLEPVMEKSRLVRDIPGMIERIVALVISRVPG